MGAATRVRRWRSALAALLACLAPASADTLVLRDGRVFDGVTLERTPDGAQMRFEHGDVLVPWGRVVECIIGGDDGFQPTTDEERAKLADGYVHFDGRWVRPSQRDKALAKLLEEQAAAIEEIKGSRLWRNRKTEETKHYLFEYTVPQQVFEGFRDLMETYTDEFLKTWKIRTSRDTPKLKVEFYVDYDAFLQVTGMPRGVLGYFRFVEPYELAIYYDRVDPRRTEEVIYHEVGHYLQQLLDREFNVPHWPGEPISEYYAGSTWDPEKKQLTTGLVMESRLSNIQLEIKEGKWVGLREMILGCQDRNFTDYSWGWSLVHFLMNDKRYRDGFLKLFKGLSDDPKIERSAQQYTPTTRLKTVEGPAMLEAFQRYLKLRKDEDLDELQREWYAYLEDKLAVTTARGLLDAGTRAMSLDRNHRAKRLFEEAIATGDAGALAYFRLAEVMVDLGERKDALPHFAKAVELDPLVPEYYIEWGEALLADDATKDEGRRLLLLAQDIEPDNFYLERNLKRLLK